MVIIFRTMMPPLTLDGYSIKSNKIQICCIYNEKELFLKNYRHLLSRCRLFDGIGASDLDKLLNCLSAIRKRYKKGGVISTAGANFNSVGLVLSGSVHIIQDDFWGNRALIARFEPVEIFGEAFAFSERGVLSVSIMAAEQSDILLINCGKIISACPSACVFHATLIKNIVKTMALKNSILMQKIEHVTCRTTREKLLSYLSFQARQMKNNVFEIPFNRQELADYLSVDRSAMSSELGRMRGEGILRFSKNRFELLEGR
jgi:CRP-like cAMP-binding protein